jgi:hypothetical protein
VNDRLLRIKIWTSKIPDSGTVADPAKGVLSFSFFHWEILTRDNRVLESSDVPDHTAFQHAAARFGSSPNRPAVGAATRTRHRVSMPQYAWGGEGT